MSAYSIWEYYQSEAPEVFEGSVGRLRHLARRVESGKVLNIGVGAGVFERIALDRGLDVHSIDPSERAVESLRERLGMGGKAKVGAADRIPFPDASFDAVVVSELIEHLPDEVLARAIDEIGRVLIPGGMLAGTVPACENLAEQRVVCPRCGERFHRWGHVQSFDPGRLRTLLASRFRVEEISRRPFFHWGRLNWKGRIIAAAKLSLSRLGVRGAGESIVFIARRKQEQTAADLHAAR
ncbi:MAG: class I SAM-dependent methyltransferase [bacterium]|nr:class I SAM-dependent methyltransferase [bacterium]